MKSLAATLPLIAVSALAAPADPVELATFAALPRPEPTLTFQYGEAQSQGVDVFLPQGRGPHPVAILIHGGCWSARTAGREQLRHLGAELAREGVAVWSIGYRRANESGGGYPGAYLDVGAAIDRVVEAAREYDLDLTRTVMVGHSAGGHLALWAAARSRLPASSALHSAAPFTPQKVISLAGIGDLERFARFVPLHCGPDILDKLTPNGEAPGKYADVSPAAMPPPAANVLMVSGVLDRLVPPYVAFDYARAIRDRGGSVELLDIAGAGHFDVVMTGARAWTEVKARIHEALQVQRQSSR